MATEVLQNRLPQSQCISTCPECHIQFRLGWRIGRRALKRQNSLRLTCPGCGAEFFQPFVTLKTVEAPRTNFPVSFVVRPECVVD